MYSCTHSRCSAQLQRNAYIGVPVTSNTLSTMFAFLLELMHNTNPSYLWPGSRQAGACTTHCLNSGCGARIPGRCLQCPVCKTPQAELRLQRAILRYSGKTRTPAYGMRRIKEACIKNFAQTGISVLLFACKPTNGKIESFGMFCHHDVNLCCSI
jgi:hypothetical protein